MAENLEKLSADNEDDDLRNKEGQGDVIDRFMSAQSKAEGESKAKANASPPNPKESHLWASNVDLTATYENKSSKSSNNTKESSEELEEAA